MAWQTLCARDAKFQGTVETDSNETSGQVFIDRNGLERPREIHIW
jgi:hypothetical protein